MEQLSTCANDARRHAVECGVAPQDREDLVQETLARVWKRQRADREAGGSLTALVRKTLAAIVVDWRRRGRTHAELVDEPRTTRSGLDFAQMDERRRAVHRAIEALPAAQREVVHLRYFEGLKFRQIAEREGIPLNTVLARMHRAARRLRSTLEVHDD